MTHDSRPIRTNVPPQRHPLSTVSMPERVQYAILLQILEHEPPTDGKQSRYVRAPANVTSKKRCCAYSKTARLPVSATGEHLPPGDRKERGQTIRPAQSPPSPVEQRACGCGETPRRAEAHMDRWHMRWRRVRSVQVA
jgi:hypothetical protein